MENIRHSPGAVRDAIFEAFAYKQTPLSVKEVYEFVSNQIGSVPRSSVQSYLSLNEGITFNRLDRGLYDVASETKTNISIKDFEKVSIGQSLLYHGDCFEVLKTLAPNSIHAVVTDPPYGIREYSPEQVKKLRTGRGGVWRVPPSFDGNKRSPLPRFTTLSKNDLSNLEVFIYQLGLELMRILVPGAHIIMASNPLLQHHVTNALVKSGFEVRGAIIRKVVTMRGGDRPKNAHLEFQNVSVMPRASWEPWILVRKPIEGRVQDNLKKWNTGGLRRISETQPFFDMIDSRPTQRKEKKIAPHPSLKPQKFLRQIVRAALPLSKGVILDPFAGSGSTLAAANALQLESMGIETDIEYFKMAKNVISKLQNIEC